MQPFFKDSHIRSWARLVLLAFLLLPCLSSTAVLAQQRTSDEPLMLDDSTPEINAWPSVTLLFDAQKQLTLKDALAKRDDFTAPTTNYATLGVRQEAVWLRVPLQTQSASNGEWIVDIDYPVLHRVDMYLTQNGRVLHETQLGSLRPFENRPLLSRIPAMELQLQPAQRYELYIRVDAKGPKVLPLSISKPKAFHQRATAEQMLQGLLAGIGLTLLLYSLGQWLSLREPLFIKYAVLVMGSMTFALLQFGIGTQFIWRNNFWIEQHIGILAALVALGGSFLFMEQALADGKSSPLYSRVMRLFAGFSVLLAVVYAFDIIDTRIATSIVSVMGPLPTLISLPYVFERARFRDPVGVSFLLAWLFYMMGAAILIGVVRGVMPVNFWTLHSFQFASVFDNLAFLYVLSLRTKAVRMAANRASQERDVLRSLALTDPLTGLANRRSMNEALKRELGRATGEELLAIYVIDVDGFKPVNDRYGHDAGDDLLVGIADRMKATLRKGDVVARLGGDEFVVLVSGLLEPLQAQEMGNNLIAVFKQPFELQQGLARVGLTIGYAIAPLDGQDAGSLLKLADEAMYQGKQDGKGCLRRANLTTGGASSTFRTQTGY